MKKNKIYQILKYFGAVILLLFVLFEIYYYGSKVGGRSLTDNEVSILKTVYGTSINYEQVKIFDHKFAPKCIQNDNMAIAPNGGIYFPPNNYSSDFGQKDLYTQRWLIHEMIHVYQYQHMGQKMFWKAVYLAFLGLQGKNVYQYDIDYDKILSNYNLEQQGDIVGDYFLRMNGRLELSEKEVEWYKRIVKGFIKG